MKPPVNYTAIRKALVAEVKKSCVVECIVEETTVQGAQRPAKPYMSFKITTPGIKWGDDSPHGADGSDVVMGGQRSMSVSFHAYGNTRDQAYELMSLWQASLDLKTVQARLREGGIAVWLIQTLADASELLNTGWEGRAQMDVQFGMASNLGEDPGTIEVAEIEGSVDTDAEVVTLNFTVPD